MVDFTGDEIPKYQVGKWRNSAGQINISPSIPSGTSTLLSLITSTTFRTMVPSRQLVSTIFASLSRESCRWSLIRTLKSDNPLDIQGELRGTATFTPLRQSAATNADSDIVYREEGDMPNSMPGLRWSKKYIWRLSKEGTISVWFVKVTRGGNSDSAPNSADEEPDYLFHEFDFGSFQSASEGNAGKDEIMVSPPQPPQSSLSASTTILMARGNHLCINDMYRTAYAFRIHSETGEVLTWSSRHVVKGPKKNQDIVNLYQMEGMS